MKKVRAYIVFKDGSGHIAEYKLKNGLSFARTEMEQWIREFNEKPIKSITFIPNNPLNPTTKDVAG